MELYFDPLKQCCKNPVGAVRAGTAIRFKVFAGDTSEGLTLKLRSRFGGETVSVPFSSCEDGYTAEYTAQQPDVLFYGFALSDGSFYGTDDTLGICLNGQEFIQTVYTADFNTPREFAGRVMYQIFPDSFCAGGLSKDGVPTDREYLARTQLPRWQPDASGRYSNCYYGGDLAGITDKLPYLADLGVSVVYLNPIFEAHSNHRYNTGDYMKIDPLLGNEADFVRMCTQAGKLGIKIILDGVFSHTGDDSIYFDRHRRYRSGGAYHNPDSKYNKWYKREHGQYRGWWGIPTLPETDETNEDYAGFICGENGVLRHWLRLGASGWRLDVADELPDSFIRKIRAAVKAEGGALLIGEVWEDAVTKESYGEKRRYLLGEELDSVMNYPLRTAIIEYMRTGESTYFVNTVRSQLNEYPPECLAVLMNMLATHDTPRLLTALSGAGEGFDMKQKAGFVLPKEDYLRALELAKLAYVLLFTLYGIPCVYYGEERGMQGFGDPLCRAYFAEDCTSGELPALISGLAKLRGLPEFVDGSLEIVCARGGLCAFVRALDTRKTLVVLNRSDDAQTLEYEGKSYTVAAWRWLIQKLY